MPHLWAKLKPFLRWAILGGTLFFVGKTLKDHWQDVAQIRIEAIGWACLAIALGITLLAHIWSGWVWSWILHELGQSVSGAWGVLTYLKTNIAKYLPGNVWHFYGRVWAAKAIGVPLPAAALSVLMEPLLMAASALAIALISTRRANTLLQLVCLGLILCALHPRVLNPALKILSRMKSKPQQFQDAIAPPNSPAAPPTESVLQVKRYPLVPLLGELVFLGLRGTGFVFTVMAFQAIDLAQVPLLISVFSFAWLLGLVIPGAPGGIGVFEATAIALLGDGAFLPGVVLSAVASYRLVSVLAEAGGAGLAWLDDRR